MPGRGPGHGGVEGARRDGALEGGIGRGGAVKGPDQQLNLAQDALGVDQVLEHVLHLLDRHLLARLLRAAGVFQYSEIVCGAGACLRVVGVGVWTHRVVGGADETV